MKWFKGSTRAKGLILLYHRVNESRSDPQLLSVTPQRFAKQLAHLSRHYHVVSLNELVRDSEDTKDQTTRRVAVTFDDGYADNLLNAKPLLEAYKTPATVFVSTGYIDRKKEFWWDDLERMFLHPSVLPAALSLEINGHSFKWDLGNVASYGTEDFAAHRMWNVLRKDNPTVRQRIYRALCSLLRPLSKQERDTILHALRIWANIEDGMQGTHRPLTSAEVRELGSGELVEVGAHSVSHSVLSGLPVSDQRDEISQSKVRLEEILGHPVNSFAYPFGTKSDYTEQTAILVREGGFSLACSNFPETVTERTERYQLPRFIVRDWSEDTFAHTVGRWFDGNVGEGPDGP
jgi:peptidoglycan/xylan/chitin deacetylase (PgdA/CDA1 family)